MYLPEIAQLYVFFTGDDEFTIIFFDTIK